MSLEMKDSKNRIVVHMNRKGKLALSRFPDMSEKEITYLIKAYCDLDEEANADDVEKFLRYTNEDEKFCS